MRMMGRTFKDSCNQDRGDIIEFSLPSTSPACRAIVDLAERLHDMASPLWHPVLVAAGGQWSEAALHMTAYTALGYIANLSSRTLFLFEEFPLKLCQIVHPDADLALRTSVALEVHGLGRCCLNPTDGFTWMYKSMGDGCY